jgi:hypothetical protein
MSIQLKLSMGVALAFAAVLGPSEVFADSIVGNPGFVYLHGSRCVPSSPSDAGLISYSQYGVHNDSETDTAWVTCFIGLPGREPNVPTASHRIVMNGYDRHPTQQVTCDFLLVDAVGVVAWSAFKNTTGSSTASKSFFVEFPYAFIEHFAVASCSIPPVSSGLNSHITSFAGY